MKDMLTIHVETLTVEELKTAYAELKELDKTGVLAGGITRNAYNVAKEQNPSITITTVRVAIYEKLLEKLL